MKKMVLSSFLVELMISVLWGMLTFQAGGYRASVPSNFECNTGFKALKAVTIFFPVTSLLLLLTTKCTGCKCYRD